MIIWLPLTFLFYQNLILLLLLLLLLLLKAEINHVNDVARAFTQINRKKRVPWWTLQCQTVTATASSQSRNDNRNSCVFVSRWSCRSELAVLVAGGKLFQALAAATGNARLPRVKCRVDGICCVLVSLVPNSTTRTPATDMLYTTPPMDKLTAVLQLLVQQICHIAMPKPNIWTSGHVKMLGCDK